jgi:hypothetical protein
LGRLGKIKLIALGLLLFSWPGITQTNSISSESIFVDSLALPKPINPILYSIDLLPENNIFIPLNGGILLTNDKQWLMPPDSNYFIESFTIDRRKGDIIFISNKDSINYIISANDTKLDTISAVEGHSFRMYNNGNFCLVNGILDKKPFLLIYDMIKEGVQAFYDFDRPVLDFELLENDCLLAIYNEIYLLNIPSGDMKLVHRENEVIFGLTVMDQNSILISTKKELKVINVEKETRQISYPQRKYGPLYSVGDMIMLHSVSSNYLYRLNNKLFNK